jgi:DNA-binding beta-propeller fold protein YncE
MKKLILVAGIVLVSCLLFPVVSFAQGYVAITSPQADSTSTFTGSQVTITGTSVPDATITIHIDGSVTGSTTANSEGAWSYQASRLSPGTHTVSAAMQGATHYAYMANPGQGSVDIVDVEAHEFIERIGGFDSITDLLYSPSGKVYATIDGKGGCKLGVVDPADPMTVSTIDIDDGCVPGSIAANPDGSKLYTVYTDVLGDYNVGVVDTATDTMAGTFPLGLDPSTSLAGVAINPANTEVWVRTGTGIDIYALSDYSHNRTITFAGAAYTSSNIVFSAGGDLAYTGDSFLGVVHVIATADDSYTDIPTGAQTKNVAITSDDSKLYAIASYPTQKIYTISTASNTVIDTADAAQPPESIGVSPDGKAFVAGDDHGTGEIYFGRTLQNATITATITAPDGGSYYTYNSYFIAPPGSRTFSTSAITFAIAAPAGGSLNTTSIVTAKSLTNIKQLSQQTATQISNPIIAALSTPLAKEHSKTSKNSGSPSQISTTTTRGYKHFMWGLIVPVITLLCIFWRRRRKDKER